MDIFGIGPLEIAFILLLVIIIFGPKDLMKTGKTIGRSLNKFIRSDTWKTINQTTQELKNLPNRLMREAGIEEIEQMAKEGLNSTGNNTIRPPLTGSPSPEAPDRVIDTPENPPQLDPGQPPQPEPTKPPDKDAPA